MFNGSSIFILLLMILPLTAYTQRAVSVDPLIGVNSSGFRKSDDYAQGNELTKPLISPVIGLLASRKLGDKFSLSLGIFYNRLGKKYNYSRMGYDIINNQNYSLKRMEDMIFSAVSVPILIEYHFRLIGTSSHTYLGYKAIRFITGR
jgi:hypothetical protein